MTRRQRERIQDTSQLLASSTVIMRQILFCHWALLLLVTSLCIHIHRCDGSFVHTSNIPGQRGQQGSRSGVGMDVDTEFMYRASSSANNRKESHLSMTNIGSDGDSVFEKAKGRKGKVLVLGGSGKHVTYKHIYSLSSYVYYTC